MMCVGYACAGFGISLQMAQANGFVGSLKSNTRLRFGILHAFYGGSLAPRIQHVMLISILATGRARRVLCPARVDAVFCDAALVFLLSGLGGHVVCERMHPRLRIPVEAPGW